MPSNLRRINEPGHTHFLTISTHRRIGFFHNDDMKQVVIDSLKMLQTKHNICLIGYVIMPDHIHLLIYPHKKGSDDPIPISDLIQPFKQNVGFHGKKCLRTYWRTHGSLWSDPLNEWARSDTKGKPIWNTRGYDYNIENEKSLIEKLNYCHKNPMARGLVDNALRYCQILWIA